MYSRRVLSFMNRLCRADHAPSVTHSCSTEPGDPVRLGTADPALVVPTKARVHRRRTSRSAYLCEGRCLGCGRNPWAPDVTSCKPKDVRGRRPEPHSWPEPTEEWPDPPGDDNPCSCGAHVGGYHHWLCSIEVCPWAAEHPDDGEQLLCCGCFE